MGSVTVWCCQRAQGCILADEVKALEKVLLAAEVNFSDNNSKENPPVAIFFTCIDQIPIFLIF